MSEKKIDPWSLDYDESSGLNVDVPVPKEPHINEAKIGRCKTCKHWVNDDGLSNIDLIGNCKAVVQYWDATEWSEDGCTRSLKPEYANRLAFAKDGSDYYAALKTMPDFGCWQHELRE